MSNSISTLLLRNLSDVFGENDPVRRRAAIHEIFHEDAVFYDPKGGIFRGRAEIDRIAGELRATHHDFRYQPIGEPEEAGNGGRVRWVEGRPVRRQHSPGLFIIARDGRIAAIYLFFEERHRRELLVHCYRMLGSFPDAEDAVQETSLRAWRYRDSLKEGAPLRPWLYRIATNACLDAIARDERRAVLGAKAQADDGWAGEPEDVVWLGPIPDSVLEPPAPPERTPEALTLMRETIELAFLTVIQLLTPQQRVALILCDVLDWSAKGAADLLEISVSAVNSALQRARARLRERLPSHRPAWPASVDGSAAERDLLKKYVEASEAADFRAFESIIRADATFRMPPPRDTAAGREAMFKLWIEGGFGSEQFGRLRCVVTHANLQPAVAAYVCQPGDSTWRALALDVLRIEEGLITEIVTFGPDTFPLFGLPMLMDPAPEMNTRH